MKWNKVYVFISSAFNDMHAERDYLVKRVFPELEEWCEQRRIRLIDIDLRWGITEYEATRGKNVIPICLNSIDQCRPFFLCFLGQRRGYVPQIDDISNKAFPEYPGLESHIGKTSITELEILHAAIKPFHLKGIKNTSNTKGYDKKSNHAFFYMRDPGYLSQLSRDPDLLLNTYSNSGIEDPILRSENENELNRWRVKLASSSNGNVHNYKGEWDTDVTTPELKLPLKCDALVEKNIETWRRQWRAAGIDVKGKDIGKDANKVAKANLFNKKLTRGRLTHFKSDGNELSRIIIDELKSSIEKEFPHHTKKVQFTELEKEIDQHEQFILREAEGFVERKGDFTSLDNYVSGSSKKLFVLTAAAGMGKSTLLANWIQHCRNTINEKKKESLHVRFIGKSDGSGSVNSLLHLLLNEIKNDTIKLSSEIPGNPAKLRENWISMLEEIGQKGRTIIVLDGINQLESGLGDLDWLPTQWPDNIKMIVSFKNDDQLGKSLYERFTRSKQVLVARIKPFTQLHHRRTLVSVFLSNYLKELDGKHVETILRLPGSVNPLYLKVILSELRVFGSFGSLAAKIRNDFGDDPCDAFQSLLKRLEADPVYSPLEPTKTVPLLFGFLSHSRYGLSVPELSVLILDALEIKITEKSRQEAADSIYVLLRQVRPYLASREGRYDFFYESFKTAALVLYNREKKDATVPFTFSNRHWHSRLADYFEKLPLWQKSEPGSSSKIPEQRKVAELPYQLLYALAFERLEKTLCDLQFIEAKCTAGKTYDLLNDYEQSLETFNTEGRARYRPQKNRIAEFSKFVTNESHNLQKYLHVDGFLFQQAYNYSSIGEVLEARMQLDEHPSIKQNTWIKLLNRPEGMNRLASTLERHSTGATDCAFFPDGQRLLSAGMDNTLNIWDTRSWRHVEQIAVFKEPINGCDVSSDGKHFVSACADGYTRLHNVETKDLVVCEGKFEFDARRGKFFPDGKKVISVGSGGFKIHHAKTGKLVLEGCEDEVISEVCFAPDGLIAFACSAGSILIYDPVKNKILNSLYLGESKIALGCTFSPDGKWLLATGGRFTTSPNFGESQLWNTKTWQQANLHEHEWRQTSFPSAGVSCAFLSEGKYYTIGFIDGNMQIFDTTSGECIKNIGCHGSTVRGITTSPSGEILVTASLDGQLRAWRIHEMIQGKDSGDNPGKCLYVAFSEDNKSAAVWTHITRGIDCDFFQREYELTDHGPIPREPKKYQKNHFVTFNLKMKRKDPMAAMTAVDVFSGKFGSVRHRSSPFHPNSHYWLIDSSARMWPHEYFLLPEIDVVFYSSENIIWARAAGEDLFAFIQPGILLLVYVDPFGNSQKRGFPFTWSKTRTEIPQCSFSKDKERLYWIVSDSLYVFDVMSCQFVHHLQSESGLMHSFCESPNGKSILAACDDGSVSCWDLTTGKKSKSYSGHYGAVLDCAYLDEGQFISIGKDGSLRLWQTENDKPISVFVADTGLAAFATSPDKKNGIAVDKHGRTYIFEIVTGNVKDSGTK